MCPRSGQDSEFLPLFDWPERREIHRLQIKRRELQTRIAKLPLHAHRRIELQTRLKALTEQQLELERTLERKANP